MGPRVWLLNYDAESELGAWPARCTQPIAPPPWLGSGDRWLGLAGERALDASILGASPLGVAWCPTPNALAALAAAGLHEIAAAPSAEVLRLANARETFADLHPLGAHGALVAQSVEDVERAVNRPAPERFSGRAPAWLLRRSLAAAGQGRLLVETWTEKAQAWSARALESGPLHILPVVDIAEEFSAHAYLHQGGEVEVGHHVSQVVRGAAWHSSTRCPEPVPELGVALRGVIPRLQTIGYFGPIGVDGFLWRDASGAKHMAAGTDVNARYTMSTGTAFDEVP